MVTKEGVCRDLSDIVLKIEERRLKELPMVDIAYEILKQTKKTYFYQDLVKEIAQLKGMTEEEIIENIAQLYTEINIDGRFAHVGQNEWGLKQWYPVDQADALHYSHDDDEEDDYTVYDDEELDEEGLLDEDEEGLIDEDELYADDEDEEDSEDIDLEEDTEDEDLFEDDTDEELDDQNDYVDLDENDDSEEDDDLEEDD